MGETLEHEHVHKINLNNITCHQSTAKLCHQMANINPGNERFVRSRGWLCHKVVELEHLEGLKSLTVSQVLKYSLN